MSSSVLLMFAMLVSNAGLKIDLRIDKLLIKHVTCTASNFHEAGSGVSYIRKPLFGGRRLRGID